MDAPIVQGQPGRSETPGVPVYNQARSGTAIVARVMRSSGVVSPVFVTFHDSFDAF